MAHPITTSSPATYSYLAIAVRDWLHSEKEGLAVLAVCLGPTTAVSKGPVQQVTAQGLISACPRTRTSPFWLAWHKLCGWVQGRVPGRRHKLVLHQK